MSPERFNHILRHAARFETIFIRGWGEPLTHPKFAKMVEALHPTGARIVVSTNGWAPIPEEVLPFIHTIEYRMGCGDARVFENQHNGRRFNQVLFNMARVSQWLRRFEKPYPLIRLQFIENRFTLHRLQDYLELAAKFKPVEVQFTRPGFHARRVDEDGMLPGNVPEEEVARIDSELMEIAKEESVSLTFEENESHCLFNPLDHVFVNWKGQISPCRYTLLPVIDQRFAVYHKGQRHWFNCVDLANSRTPFDFTKWHMKIRIQFTPCASRNSTANGESELPQICLFVCSNAVT